MGFFTDSIPIIGPAIGGLLGMASAQDTNRQNQQMAERQMQFQSQMSGTAHQREVQDLQAAGLNPILSAGGQGASAPTGATAQMNNPIEAAFTSAMSAKQIQAITKDIDLKDEQIKATRDQAALSRASARSENSKADILGPASAIAGGVSSALQKSRDTIKGIINSKGKGIDATKIWGPK